MHVGVDQSRQQRRVAKIQHTEVIRRPPGGRIDRRNAGAVDDNEREVFMQRLSVEDLSGSECPNLPVRHLRIA